MINFSYFVDKRIYFCCCLPEQLMELVLIIDFRTGYLTTEIIHPICQSFNKLHANKKKEIEYV